MGRWPGRRRTSPLVSVQAGVEALHCQFGEEDQCTASEYGSQQYIEDIPAAGAVPQVVSARKNVPQELHFAQTMPDCALEEMYGCLLPPGEHLPRHFPSQRETRQICRHVIREEVPSYQVANLSKGVQKHVQARASNHRFPSPPPLSHELTHGHTCTPTHALRE